MAPPVEKKKKFCGRQQQLLRKIWICSDVWMDILPFFRRPQLGLKMALLSDRFDVLVDAHFDGKTTEFTILRQILICKDKASKPILLVYDGKNTWGFPLPDRPLPNNIRFNFLRIDYIDHSVLAFLRSNKQIWDRTGTKLELFVSLHKTRYLQQIWEVFALEIWPTFVTNIRHFILKDGDDLDNLRSRTSPTILTDLNINSISSHCLCPDGIADDGPNATAGQALAKWLHTPTIDGQPKRLYCNNYMGPVNLEWVNSFKEAFRCATTSVAYSIRLKISFVVQMQIVEPFELVNERTKEMLTLEKMSRYGRDWLLKRCPFVGETATAVQLKDDGNSDANLNNVKFYLVGGSNCIGPLSPPVEKKKKKWTKASKINYV